MSMEAIDAENDMTDEITNQTQFLPNVKDDIFKNNNGGTKLNGEDSSHWYLFTLLFGDFWSFGCN
jgi:hypothetical protein